MSSEERKYNALSKPPYPDNVKNSFDDVKDAVEAYKNGEFVIVMDDEGRENEGDLVIPAYGITAEQMAWMIKWTRFVLCYDE